jgi:hypothetical protein
VSLVFEDPSPRNSKARAGVLTRLANLRARDSAIRDLVDVHLVTSLPSHNISQTRERLITKPFASNFHLNLARFFARTDMIWLVGDARVLPSNGLRDRLDDADIRRVVLDHGDSFIVPTFAPVRTGEAAIEPVVSQLRGDSPGEHEGVSESDFGRLASANIDRHRSSLRLPIDQWPQTKEALVSLVAPPLPVGDNAPPPAPAEAGEADIGGNDDPFVFALYDTDWEPNRGPTNWALWSKSASDPKLYDPPESGGGNGLDFSGVSVGGGNSPYRVDEYDAHYSPSLVLARAGVQPWCTERFASKRAACAYQTYLAGSEMWVLHDQWAYTLEYMDKIDDDGDEAEFLKVRGSAAHGEHKR